MLKMIKIYSAVALATLVMVGCGASDKGEESPEKKKSVSQYSDAEKLAYALANQRKALNAGSQDKKKSRAFDKPCKNGGTMDFGNIDIGGSFQSFDEVFFNKPITMDFRNCDDGESFLNGSMNVNLSENGEGTIEYISDFTFREGSDRGSIKRGSRVEMHNVEGWEEATINMVATVNGVTHGGENLVYRSKELPDGGYIEYPVSGEEKIGDSAYFRVDPDYDASKTPFKSDKNDVLQSGTFKYLDKNEHAVKLKITAADVVTVSVDEDGDGEFKGSEISSINLKN